MRIRNLQSSHEDRISKLSDKLIHHILSFCNCMIFAVRTSILSKRWRYVWTSLPNLDINSIGFDDRPFASRPSREWIQPTSFVNFVDGALILRNHKSDIHKFRLRWYIQYFLTNMIANHLNTWITAALNRNVVILTVDITGRFAYDRWITARYHFLCNIFNCRTLTELKLKVDVEILKDEKETEEGIALSKYYYSKITFPKSMDLHCLKVLKLKSLDIDNLNNLFLRSNCPPLLEYLSIRSCRISSHMVHMDWFNIESFTLKYLELKNSCIMPKKINLNVPNLQTFVCEDYTWHEYSMENISSLSCAHIEMLDFSRRENKSYLKLHEHEKEVCATRALNLLKALDVVNELQLSPGILEIVSGIPDLLDRCPTFQFHSVRCLKLVTYYTRTCFQAISYLMKILPNIESLSMEIPNKHMAKDYWWWYQDPSEDYEVSFSFPSMLSQLNSVKIDGLGGFDNEFKLVEFLLINATNLKEMVLYKSSDSEHNSEHCRRIQKFGSKLLACPKASSNIARCIFSLSLR